MTEDKLSQAFIEFRKANPEWFPNNQPLVKQLKIYELLVDLDKRKCERKDQPKKASEKKSKQLELI
jgi:hypothetical protein